MIIVIQIRHGVDNQSYDTFITATLTYCFFTDDCSGKTTDDLQLYSLNVFRGCIIHINSQASQFTDPILIAEMNVVVTSAKFMHMGDEHINGW